MMNTVKVSVTLRAAAIEQARRVAGPRGLSSYLSAALQEKLERDERRRALLEYLQELEASDPASPEEKRRAARRAAALRQRVST
jgi:hypothetical protein